MTLNRDYLFCLLPFLLMACHPERDVAPRFDYSRAIQLNKGNYWIYATQAVYFPGQAPERYGDDSTYIAKDTVINELLFHKLENPFGLDQFVRREREAIVNQDNQVLFSGTNFTDTLYRASVEYLYGFMENKEYEITVPAGTFKAVAFVIVEKTDPALQHPEFPNFYAHGYNLLQKTWYAKNAGVVKSTVHYGSMVYERHLKKYRVN